MADKQFLILISSIFLLSLLSAAVGYIQYQRGRARKQELRNRKSLGEKLLHLAVSFTAPKQGSFNYNRLKLRLREAGIYTKKEPVEKFYAAKLIIPLVLIIPTLFIAKYNLDYANLKTIRQVDLKKADLVVSDRAKYSDNVIKEKEEENLRYFEIIRANMDLNMIKRRDVQKDIAVLLQKKTDMSLLDAEKAAASLQKKIRSLKGAGSLFAPLYAVVFLGFMLPDFALWMVLKLRSIRRESEKILISELLMNLGSMKGIKVHEILKKLAEVTRIYKYLFKDCLENYEAGDIEAFKRVRKETADQDIIEIFELLEICQEKLDINEAVKGYELKQFEKRQMLEGMEKIKQDRVTGIADVLAVTSLFIVIFSMLAAMMSVTSIIGF